MFGKDVLTRKVKIPKEKEGKLARVKIFQFRFSNGERR